MNLWKIYYSSREYAREMGDPQLGILEAPTQVAAEELAHKTFDGRGAGLLAVLDDYARCDHCRNLDYRYNMRPGKFYKMVCSQCWERA